MTQPTPPPELLTDDEREAIAMAGRLYNLLNRIVGDGRTRHADLSEFALHIHNIQHAVMSQAAARAYPGEYRMLGGVGVWRGE